MKLENLIDSLSRDEQVIAMELLWSRISQGPDASAAPDWHRDVVKQRVEALENGTETFVDWVDAKKRLADRLR